MNANDKEFEKQSSRDRLIKGISKERNQSLDSASAIQQEFEDTNMTILTFIIYLCMAAACAWIGGSSIGPVGPSVAGLSLLPAILGSALLVFLSIETYGASNLPRCAFSLSMCLKSSCLISTRICRS